MSAAAPYRKAGFFNNRIVNPQMAALGLVPALTIRGPRSGTSSEQVGARCVSPRPRFPRGSGAA
jgi:hypothetical protein